MNWFTLLALLLAMTIEDLHSTPRIPRNLKVDSNGKMQATKCRLKRGTMKIYVPGCEQKTIKSVGCKGFCLSSSNPGVAEKMNKDFFHVCNCCQPKSSVTRDVFLSCPVLRVKTRRVRIYVATHCYCKPC